MTPDSFSGDGLISKRDGLRKALHQARRFIREGVDIIDVGGESSRPGSRRISAQEEISRIIPITKLLVSKTKTPISVDTYKPLVARHALEAGAVIINNIMGTKPDKGLLRMVSRYNAAIVLMHMRGTPPTMQRHARYANVVSEVIDSLKKSLENCLEIGIKSDRIIVDPGIGFAKTVEDNFEILRQLHRFKALRQPILIGVSRKSFIGKILEKDISQRLFGSLAAASVCICHGAHLLRVHDVAPTKDVAIISDTIIKGV